MSSAQHGGRANTAAASTSLQQQSASQRSRKRKNQQMGGQGGMGGGGGANKMNRAASGVPFSHHQQQHQQGQFPGGPGGPRGPFPPGQMPPPGMHPHMMPSTGMGFGIAEEEELSDFIIDDTSRLTARDLALARYKRNHELLNMIFDARRIDSLAPPPSPYASMDKTALQQRLADVQQETSAMKQTYGEKLEQWRRDGKEFEDMLHAPPKRLKQQREEQDAAIKAALGEQSNVDDKDAWARAPFKGRILGVGYVRAATPDEVRAQLPPSPKTPPPPPSPKPQPAQAAPVQPQQTQQPSAPVQGQEGAQAAPATSDTALGEEAGPSTARAPVESNMDDAGALADNGVPGLEIADAGEQGTGDEEDDEDEDGDNADDDADGDEDDAQGEGDESEREDTGVADAEGEDAGEAGLDDVSFGHDDIRGTQAEAGNLNEEDHMLAMGMADPDPSEQDADLQEFLASADDDANTMPFASDTGNDGSAAVQAAMADGQDGEASAAEIAPDSSALRDTSMQDTSAMEDGGEKTSIERATDVEQSAPVQTHDSSTADQDS